ncbi:NUDIX hydrolase [Criblamydia sequanensis]|uniref:Nudix hydrolase n=1 Tax=Candidatus Criblamydia sequanensis CRIB-18 TaxID=1437425 RepID=A0A090CY58_9BACT|nr:NUDIX hydrolase [Criblamydia sequanensis]CDR33161.1 Nudix hydrolase [Criblamydia sequanensis CRIB-18]
MIQVFRKKPSDFKTHVYVTAAYVKHEDKILILQLSQEKEEAFHYGVPAGKLENGELPEDGMERELFEETGIRIDSKDSIRSLDLLFMRKPKCDYIYHLFEVTLAELPEIHLSKEHQAYRWLSLEEISTLPLMLGAIEAIEFYKELQK